MSESSFRIVGLAIVAAVGLHAQLYVIAGNTPGNRPTSYSATLVRIGEDGTIPEVENIVSGPTPGKRYNVGLSWISISQERRIAVLMPKGQDRALVVLDLDKAAVVKKCDVLPALPMPVIQYNLAELPDGRMVLMARMFADGHEKLAGILLDPSISCENSLATMVPTDFLGIRILGWSGIGDMGNSDAMDIGIDHEGRLTRRTLGISFPFTVPTTMLKGFQNPLGGILASNPDLFVVGVFEKSMPHRVLVYRRRDQSWHTLALPAQRLVGEDGQLAPTPRIASFGEFLALTEVQPKSTEYPRSAGEKGWRAAATETGPSVAGRLAEDEAVFPGRLHLYDMEHERSYIITTGQADSEILLVEGGVVYYRVADKIYRASIGETALGPSQLIAQSKILGDAHWAFIRRQ